MKVGTPEYFIKEITEFRHLMGKKSFWVDDDLPRRAMYGLLYVYGQTEGLEQMYKDLMVATVKEYDIRLGYVVMAKLKGILLV